MKKRFFLSVLCSVWMVSCATSGRTTWLGVGAGAGMGATTGAVLEGDGKGAVSVAIPFAVLGALAGFFGYKALKKRDEKVRKETVFNIEKLDKEENK